MRKAPFHALTGAARGSNNVDTLFPGSARELRAPGGGGSRQRGGSGNKDLGCSTVSRTLSSLCSRTPWAEAPSCALWGSIWRPLTYPRKGTSHPFKSARAPRAAGGGVTKGMAPLLKPVSGSPYLSPPNLHHALSWRSSRWVGSSALGSSSQRKRPSSWQMKYGVGEPLETICFQ